MGKYRGAAKLAAWYAEQDDLPTYNPFARAPPLQPSVYLRPPLKTRSESALVQNATKDTIREKLFQNRSEPAFHASQNEAQGSPENTIVINEPLDEEQGLPLPSQAAASWKSWPQQKLSQVWRQQGLASGSRTPGGVRRSVADMGMSVISHAPLGTKGAPLIQVPGRPRRIMVVEYAKQDGDNIKGTQESADVRQNSTRSATRAKTGVRTGVPLLRFYEYQTKSARENICATLMYRLSSVGKPLLSQRNGRVLTNKSEHSPEAHQI